MIECFDLNKSCQKLYLNNLYIHEKIPILLSSPSGSLQSLPNSQIWWFLNLIQLFPITRYTALVEIKVVKNYVINNFKPRDQLSRTGVLNHRLMVENPWPGTQSVPGQTRINWRFCQMYCANSFKPSPNALVDIFK